MRNREYLNTLSDEEYYKAVEKLTDTCDWCPEYINGKMTCVDEKCVMNGIAWLQAEHTTTADEDFVEIGFMPCMDWMQGSDVIKYQRNKALYIQVCRDKEEGVEYWTGEKPFAFTNDLIDQIRTIADKKRKEVWGE